MALVDLLAELDRDTAAQIEGVLASAEAEASHLAGDSAARLEMRRRALLAAERQRLGTSAARELRATRRSTGAALLAARRRALDRVFAAAVARLGEPEAIARSGGGLGERLGAALALAGEGERTVIAEPALVGQLRELLAGRSEIRVEACAGTGAGFAVRAAAGAVEIDDRWRTRLARMRPALEPELARELDQVTG